MILQQIEEAGFGEIISPPIVSKEQLTQVHSSEYIEFISSAHREWRQIGGDANVSLLPHVWPREGMSKRAPESLFGKLGFFSFDAGTPLMESTWESALASASTAYYAACLYEKDRQPVFALCRPPGHHASCDYFGGYCFLNNAAIAAQHLVDVSGAKVAILDVDYHHGNGTQTIFYDRRDVLLVSIHADPIDAYPFFLGHSEEIGEGDGEGFNLNLPLPPGTNWDGFYPTVRQAIARINEFEPEYVVISLGVDTFELDPISQFTLSAEDFSKLGSALAGLSVPAMFVMEGGYAVEDIGKNVLSVLQGYERQLLSASGT